MFDIIANFINNHIALASGMGGTIMAIVMAKFFPNSTANVAVAWLQAKVDFLAAIITGIGKVLKAISDFLAALVKSDGIMGKK